MYNTQSEPDPAIVIGSVSQNRSPCSSQEGACGPGSARLSAPQRHSRAAPGDWSSTILCTANLQAAVRACALGCVLSGPLFYFLATPIKTTPLLTVLTGPRPARNTFQPLAL